MVTDGMMEDRLFSFLLALVAVLQITSKGQMSAESVIVIHFFQNIKLYFCIEYLKYV